MTEMTAGWDAITRECERVYPGQTHPKHYAPEKPWILGGNYPLDGISVYDGGDYWHFVTYGLSELYEKDSGKPGVSGFGMEMTMKLKKADCPDTEAEILSVCTVLQQLARVTFQRGVVFRAGQTIYTGQKKGIDARGKSAVTGFITIKDRDLKSLDTPNGRVDFTELIGCTEKELLAVRAKKTSIPEICRALGTDVTSYSRASLI